MKTITCIVRGKVEIDPDQIAKLHTIRADNINTTQIDMKTGPSYYVQGKDQFEVADELGIVLKAVDSE